MKYKYKVRKTIKTRESIIMSKTLLNSPFLLVKAISSCLSEIVEDVSSPTDYTAIFNLKS